MTGITGIEAERSPNFTNRDRHSRPIEPLSYLYIVTPCPICWRDRGDSTTVASATVFTNNLG
ncbi:MAG: hypothetical protein F6J93_24025 [Oscillatoria sp. SIO1A7]|nr:hypothetical protein [Oscillatoria sp. SIO1A7]